MTSPAINSLCATRRDDRICMANPSLCVPLDEKRRHQHDGTHVQPANNPRPFRQTVPAVYLNFTASLIANRAASRQEVASAFTMSSRRRKPRERARSTRLPLAARRGAITAQVLGAALLRLHLRRARRIGGASCRFIRRTEEVAREDRPIVLAVLMAAAEVMARPRRSGSRGGSAASAGARPFHRHVRSCPGYLAHCSRARRLLRLHRTESPPERPMIGIRARWDYDRHSRLRRPLLGQLNSP